MSSFSYVPILKWKQGEQRALSELDAPDRRRMLPLIELVPLKTSSTKSFRDALTDELQKAAVKLKKAKLDDATCAIDVTRMAAPVSSPGTLLSTVVRSLVSNGIRVAPVVHPGMLAIESELDKLKALAEQPTFVLRIRMSSVLHSQVHASGKKLRAIVSSKSNMHIVLDAHDIVGRSPDVVAAESQHYIAEALKIGGVTSVTFAGGSFPLTLAGIGKGNTKISRVEWHAWQKLRSDFSFDMLRFGDYTVTNPELPVIDDPTRMNPAAAIRYATAGEWMLMKAGGAKTGGFEQYNDLCRLLVKHSAFKGPAFSFGDRNYEDYAKEGATSGNYMTWRRDATSHHLVLTARELAKLA